MQDLHAYLTPQRQAHIYGVGFASIVVLGTLSLAALLLAAIWLVLQFAMLLLDTLIASGNELALTFAGADPFVRLLVLAGVGFVVYQAVRKARRHV